MQLPAETPLAEKLAGDDVVETANLTTTHTDVPSTYLRFAGDERRGRRMKISCRRGGRS